MRHVLIFAFLFCSAAANAQWYGFCIVDQNHTRVCTAPHPREGDFSPICNAFARQEGADYWRAQFFSSLDYLRSSVADYCDMVRGDDAGAMYACQVATWCPGDAQHTATHLGSRVYAASEQQAKEYCFEKEEGLYMRNFVNQSRNDCFARVAVEKLH